MNRKDEIRRRRNKVANYWNQMIKIKMPTRPKTKGEKGRTAEKQTNKQWIKWGKTHTHTQNTTPE